MLYYGDICASTLMGCCWGKTFLEEMRKKTYVMHDAYEENDKKAENALSSVK